MNKLFATFNPENMGCDIESSELNKMLGQARYEVLKVEMGQSYTSIELDNIANSVNSIFLNFEDAKGAEVDIYRSKYNPYM